jgi:dTDP-4-dehydrorhamnose 3,5-epimerase
MQRQRSRSWQKTKGGPPMTGDARRVTGDQGPASQPELLPQPQPQPLSALPGVRIDLLSRFEDQRGWLTELFRSDMLEAAGVKEAQPVMGYLSMTRPGVTRGPHEHREQTDLLVFLGPSDFEVTLWDNRTGSPTFGRREAFTLGANRPATITVPPAVVHAYRNVGKVEGWVLNFPDRLYRGPGRRESADDIRYEDDPKSDFKVEAKAEVEVKAETNDQ